jgi:hypothetical protein
LGGVKANKKWNKKSKFLSWDLRGRMCGKLIWKIWESREKSTKNAKRSNSPISGTSSDLKE